MFYAITDKYVLERVCLWIVFPNVCLFLPQACCIFVWTCLCVFSKYYVNFVLKHIGEPYKFLFLVNANQLEAAQSAGAGRIYTDCITEEG